MACASHVPMFLPDDGAYRAEICRNLISILGNKTANVRIT